MILLAVGARYRTIRPAHQRRAPLVHFARLSFQPSELAKIALIIALAWYGERYQRQMHTWKRGILIPGLLIGLVLRA